MHEVITFSLDYTLYGKKKKTSQHGTQNVKTHNRTTQTKKMSNTDPTKKPGMNLGTREG